MKKMLSLLLCAVLALACIALFMGCVALQHVCHARGVQYNVWYDNGALMLCGLMAFILMSKMPPQWFTNSKPEPRQGDMATPRQQNLLSRVSYVLSYYSFALYLTHLPVQILLKASIKQLPLSMPLQTIVLFLSSLLISLAACWLIAKPPVIGKRLLYLK